MSTSLASARLGLYGIWLDWFFATTKPTVSWSKSLIGGAAFPSFQLPIYGLTLQIVGADKIEIGTLLVSIAVLMLLISRSFGLFLQTMRMRINDGLVVMFAPQNPSLAPAPRTYVSPRN